MPKKSNKNKLLILRCNRQPAFSQLDPITARAAALDLHVSEYIRG